MSRQHTGSQPARKRRSLNRRILGHTTRNILAVVFLCCVIMGVSMQSLANNILLDSLQPMVRQSAKTVEANIHMLADRMMTIAGDTRMRSTGDLSAAQASRAGLLTEAAEIYELHTIALYDLDGRLMQGIDGAPEHLADDFLALLQETDNMTTHPSTIFQGKLGVTMGMPVKQDGETVFYVVGVYKYDALDDVLSSINIGKHGLAYMVNREGVVVGHPNQALPLRGETLDQLTNSHEEVRRRVISNETGASEFGMGLDTMLVAYAPIRGTQWSLVLQMPKSDYNYLINAAMVSDILITLAVLVISIVLVLRLARSISRPVKHVTGRMVALSNGDLHTEVIVTESRDELEVLTRTLDSTVDRMNQYISDIQQVLTQIAGGNLDVSSQVEYQGDFTLIQQSLRTIIQSMNETILGFRSAASRLSQMAEELNGQSNQLHHASLEQNQSTEALAGEVVHVQEQLASVTQSSSQTRAKTEEIAQRVQEANQQMDSLTSAMDNISANAQEINMIAKAIEDVAFQTGILAINASIEAARAGTAGRGFAVVAGEVKDLAARSAEAAKSATEVVSRTRSIIQTGVELTAQTAESVQAISGVSGQISAISDQLVTAVQGQKAALSIIETRIGEITDIADRNLQNAGESEQASALLAREASALQAKVEQFTLKEEQET